MLKNVQSTLSGIFASNNYFFEVVFFKFIYAGTGFAFFTARLKRDIYFAPREFGEIGCFVFSFDIIDSIDSKEEEEEEEEALATENEAVESEEEKIEVQEKLTAAEREG